MLGLGSNAGLVCFNFIRRPCLCTQKHPSKLHYLGCYCISVAATSATLVWCPLLCIARHARSIGLLQSGRKYCIVSLVHLGATVRRFYLEINLDLCLGAIHCHMYQVRQLLLRLIVKRVVSWPDNGLVFACLQPTTRAFDSVRNEHLIVSWFFRYIIMELLLRTRSTIK